jgi:hypothetical protein
MREAETMDLSLNLIDLATERKKRAWINHDPEYQLTINRMSKLELLEEMVRFHEKRPAHGEMSFDLLVKGRILFRSLAFAAETAELRLLTGSYLRHLDEEITLRLKKEPAPSNR